jgi:tetratricopeptide (TPR) repeat protein
MRIARAIGDLWLVSSFAESIGTVHYEQGEREAAMGYWNEVDRIAKYLGHPLLLAQGLCISAILHADEGDYECALEKYEEAEKLISDTYGITSFLATLWIRKAIVLNAMGRTSQATSLAAKAYHLAKSQKLGGIEEWALETIMAIAGPDNVIGMLKEPGG